MEFIIIDIIGYCLLPIIISISSIILGTILMRRYFFAQYLPWTMSLVFFFTWIIYFILSILNDNHYFWIIDVWCYAETSLVFIFWGFWIILSNLVISFLITMYFKFFCKAEYIKEERSYRKLCIYMSNLPTIIILFIALQYNLCMSGVCAKYGIIYALSIILCSILYILLKRTIKTYSKIDLYMNLLVNLILILYLIKNQNTYGFQWYVSYQLVHLFCFILYEVKRSKDEKYPNEFSDSVDISLLSYIPIIVMVLCCYLFSLGI